MDSDAYGLTLILLVVAFAPGAQDAVLQKSLELASQKHPWSRRAMSATIRAIRVLPREQQGRVKGRLALYTGWRWLQRAMKHADCVAKLSVAGRAIANLLLHSDGPTSATAEDRHTVSGSSVSAEPVLLQVCVDALRGVPGLGAYGVAAVLRCAVAVRDGGLQGLTLSADLWRHAFLQQNSVTTKQQMEHMGIVSKEDASCAVYSLVCHVRGSRAFKSAQRWACLNVLDVPLQACEMNSFLRVVAKSLSCPHPCSRRICKWILKRVPWNRVAANALATSVRTAGVNTGQHRTGLDVNSASNFACRWIAMKPAMCSLSWWDALGSQRMLRSLRLPVLFCCKCGSSLVHPSLLRKARTSLCKRCRNR